MPEVEEETEMDPVTAAGAAKGLMTTASSVSKNSLFQALFLPTAKAYGDHWGAETREKLQQAKAAKKRSNIASHLQAVQPQISVEFKPDPELTEAWMSGAEDIDPVDEELSRAWRATLLAIGEANPHRKRMLETVRGMSAEEASAFEAIFRRVRRTPLVTSFYGIGRQYPASISEHRGRLESLGLVHSRWHMLFSPYGRQAIAMVGFMVATGLLVGPMFSVVRGQGELVRIWSEAVTPLTLSLAFLLGFMMLMRMMMDLSLTSFGHSLAAAIVRLGDTQSGKAHVTEPAIVEPVVTDPPKPKRTGRKAGARGKSEDAPA